MGVDYPPQDRPTLGLTTSPTLRFQAQDAVPMTLGQEFWAYAVMIGSAMRNLNHTVAELHGINMGATAIGTGLNSPRG